VDGPDAELTGPRERRLSQLEERMELLEHDSVLMLIEELRNDVRKQLRAAKKERREESHRFQQTLEKVQDQLQQQVDNTDSKLSALHIRVDEKVSGTDSHMLRRTAELAAMIDELMEETGALDDRRPQPPTRNQERSGARVERGSTANDGRVDQLSEQVAHLSSELEKTRAKMQSMHKQERSSACAEESDSEPDRVSTANDGRDQLSEQVGHLSSELEKTRAEMQSMHKQERSGARVEESDSEPDRVSTANDGGVDQLSEQVGHLYSELEKTRAEMQQMRDAFSGLRPESVTSIVGLAGSVQDELRELRAEVGALEAVTHEALRAQESEIVAQRKDINSLADELREVATALEHIARAQTQRA
jgi:uncharacterized phage infection (PIP) family protein YhgE